MDLQTILDTHTTCAHYDVLMAYANELSHNEYTELERRIEDEQLSSEELEEIIEKEYL